MKLKNALAFLLVISSVTWTKGQLNNVQGLDNVLVRTKKYEDIKGSAYLYPMWNSGTLTDKSGKVYSNLLLKYDSYKDQVEMNQDGQVFEISAALYPKFTLSFVQPTTNNVLKHVFSAAYTVDGFPKMSYFELLFEGRLTLIKKYKTSFVEENVSGYGTGGAQKSFQSKTFYFVIEDGVAKDIKPNKKSVLGVFPEQSSIVETFLKEKKMKIKSETDLIEIIKFLEEN
jgi:hypothetical protein